MVKLLKKVQQEPEQPQDDRQDLDVPHIEIDSSDNDDEGDNNKENDISSDHIEPEEENHRNVSFALTEALNNIPAECFGLELTTKSSATFPAQAIIYDTIRKGIFHTSEGIVIGEQILAKLAGIEGIVTTISSAEKATNKAWRDSMEETMGSWKNHINERLNDIANDIQTQFKIVAAKNNITPENGGNLTCKPETTEHSPKEDRKRLSDIRDLPPIPRKQRSPEQQQGPSPAAPQPLRTLTAQQRFQIAMEANKTTKALREAEKKALCILCQSDDHVAKFCDQYLTTAERTSRLQRVGRCQECSRYHSGKCQKSRQACEVCGNSHLTLLCPIAFDDQPN